MAYTVINGKLVRNKKIGTAPMNGLMFTLTGELAKMCKIVTDDVTAYDTRGNQDDFNSVNWGNDGGFFIAVLPRNPQGLYSTHSRRQELTAMMENYKVVPQDDNWAVLSCYCSPDRAWQHFNEIADNLHYAFIGYSTPAHLNILAEDKNLCQALKDGTKPVVKIKEEA